MEKQSIDINYIKDKLRTLHNFSVNYSMINSQVIARVSGSVVMETVQNDRSLTESLGLSNAYNDQIGVGGCVCVCVCVSTYCSIAPFEEMKNFL